MIKVRRIPDGPATGWKKGANENSIKEGEWYSKKHYARLGDKVNENIDTILASNDYKVCRRNLLQTINKLPKHIVKPIEIKLEKLTSKKQITELTYRMILRYSL